MRQKPRLCSWRLSHLLAKQLPACGLESVLFWKQLAAVCLSHHLLKLGGCHDGCHAAQHTDLDALAQARQHDLRTSEIMLTSGGTNSRRGAARQKPRLRSWRLSSRRLQPDDSSRCNLRLLCDRATLIICLQNSCPPRAWSNGSGAVLCQACRNFHAPWDTSTNRQESCVKPIPNSQLLDWFIYDYY